MEIGAEVTQDELIDWTQYKVTQAFIKAVNDRIKELYLEMGNGRTLDISDAEATLGNTAKAIGMIEGLQEVLDIYIIKE